MWIDGTRALGQIYRVVQQMNTQSETRVGVLFAVALAVAGQATLSGVAWPLPNWPWAKPAEVGMRLVGGLAIYDAPEPWGPWTTVFHTDEWDTAPGETSCLPTKWMSRDGRTVHLVFSGGDSFSVRRATLILAE